jgi:DNA-binding protein WhiA
MSLTQAVKKEIISGLSEMQPCCKVAFLSAVFRALGSILISSGGMGLVLSAENRALILLIKKIVYQLYGYSGNVETEKNPLKKRNIYSIRIFDETILNETRIIFNENGLTKIYEGTDKYLLIDDCCRRSFVKGLFLGCGTVMMPKLNKNEQVKTNVSYHLEFDLSNERFAYDLTELLKKEGLNYKIFLRNDRYIVYVKDSATVSDTLAYLNADKAVLYLQNLLIEKSLRNNANRQSNCITANIDKSVNAAEKQIRLIEKIKNKIGLEKLSEELFITAKLRLDNPSSSMAELAAKSGLSKSGLFHRINKLTQIALKLKE